MKISIKLSENEVKVFDEAIECFDIDTADFKCVCKEKRDGSKYYIFQKDDAVVCKLIDTLLKYKREINIFTTTFEAYITSIATLMRCGIFKEIKNIISNSK